jgi:hypothetical protein
MEFFGISLGLFADFVLISFRSYSGILMYRSILYHPAREEQVGQ